MSTMLLDSLGDVIATRILFVRDVPTRKVTIIMGKPRVWDDGPDYLCPILITGIGDEKIKSAAGVDAFQSIELALKMISLELRTIRRRHQIDLCRWEGDEDPYVGFPPPGAS